MKARSNQVSFLLIGLLILGIAASASAGSRDHGTVRGIVESVDENVLTVAGHRYDITGVPILNRDGTASERGISLRGKMADILYRKGKIVSVTVSLPVPM